MTAIRLRRAAPVATVALAALLSASCSSGVGTVKGTVTVGGKPLPNGLITFESEVGNKDPFSAAIADGAYETGPIPAGPCKITITHAAMARPAVGGNDLTPARAARGKSAIEVPAKYARSDTSGLTFTVKSGANTFDKDLTP